MDISVATFIFTFLFSIIMIFILALLLHSKVTYGYMGLQFLTAFCWIILLRLLLPIEFLSYTITIPSKKALPLIRNVLDYPVFTARGYPITIFSAIIFLWIVGIIIYNFRLLRAYGRLSILSKFSEEHYDMAEQILDTLKKERGITKKISVIQNPCFTTPTLTGIFHNVIFLPQTITRK